MTDGNYATLAELKAYLNIDASETDDDTLLSRLLAAGENHVETIARRWFHGVTATRKYDGTGPHIDGRTLLLDADLISVTTLTNGDGSTLTEGTHFVLRPSNTTPKSEIRLLASGGAYWTWVDDIEEAISVAGVWGYCAAEDCPENITQAAIRTAAGLYRSKDSLEDQDRPVAIAGAGVILPGRISAQVNQLVGPYVRAKIGAI